MRHFKPYHKKKTQKMKVAAENVCDILKENGDLPPGLNGGNEYEAWFCSCVGHSPGFQWSAV